MSEITPFSEADLNKFLESQKRKIGKAINTKVGRCVDGRYDERTALIAPLATPGANAGQLGVVLAARNKHGFVTDRDQYVEAILTTIGGIKNFSMHNLATALIEGSEIHCGHFAEIFKDPTAYGLIGEDVDYLKRILPEMLRKGAQDIQLHGNHEERAIVVVENPELNVLPRSINGQVFVYHEMLDNKFYSLLAKNLGSNRSIPDASVFLPTLQDIARSQLNITLGRLPSAKGLQTFHIK